MTIELNGRGEYSSAYSGCLPLRSLNQASTVIAVWMMNLADRGHPVRLSAQREPQGRILYKV
jgi:hypothetical protein